MNEVSTILTEAVAPQGTVDVSVPGLRHGDITEGTGQVTVGGFVQTEVALAVDYQSESIHVQNLGEYPWAQGAALVVTWEGVSLEATVKDHETRIDALEAGGGSGGGTDPALESRVAALESAVDTLNWQINGHESRITNNYNAIQNHEARLDALEAARAGKT